MVDREAGLAVDVEPRHYFNTLFPPAVLYQSGGKPGIVPDAAIDVALPRVVTARGASQARTVRSRCAASSSTSRPVFGTGFGGGGLYSSARARDDRSGAVAHRAQKVEGEYRRHANRLDERYSAQGTTPIRVRGSVEPEILH